MRYIAIVSHLIAEQTDRQTGSVGSHVSETVASCVSRTASAHVDTCVVCRVASVVDITGLSKPSMHVRCPHSKLCAGLLALLALERSTGVTAAGGAAAELTLFLRRGRSPVSGLCSRTPATENTHPSTHFHSHDSRRTHTHRDLLLLARGQSIDRSHVSWSPLAAEQQQTATRADQMRKTCRRHLPARSFSASVATWAIRIQVGVFVL